MFTFISQQGNKFVKTQTLRPTDKTSNTRFGQKIDFDGNTLAITSKGGDLERVTTFDNNTTVFDNNNTQYKLIDNDSGLISLYETLNDSLLYSSKTLRMIKTHKTLVQHVGEKESCVCRFKQSWFYQ